MFFYSNTESSTTGTWLFIDHNTTVTYNKLQIDALLSGDSYYYYTVSVPTAGNPNDSMLLTLKYHDVNASSDTTVKSWNLAIEGIPSTDGDIFYIGFGKLYPEPMRPANTSPIFIHSNNITSMSFVQSNPCTIGNFVSGYSTKEVDSTNWTKLWDKSQPVFYKYSFVNNKLLGIHGDGCNYTGQSADLADTKFDVLVKDYGFEDLYIDMRERLTVNIHYNVISNNYNEFYKNNFLFFYNQQYIPTEGERYPSNSTFSAKIVELNTNIDWMNNLITSTTKTGSLIFKRIPKSVSMADYMINQSNYNQYSTAVGELKSVAWNDLEFGFQRDYYALVTSSSSLTDNNNIYNYVLINKEQNGNEIPLHTIIFIKITPPKSICT